MDIRFLNNLSKSLEFIEQGVIKLHMDYRKNIEENLFEAAFGRRLNFEEFLVMMIIEKDLQLKLFQKRTEG